MAKKQVEVKEFQRKTVSFAGAEHGDIVYYMAKIFAAEDEHSVLVIDNSKRHDLFETVKIGFEDKASGDLRKESRYLNDFRRKGSITYTKNALYSEGVFDRFDYVLVYHGMNADKEIWDNSDVRFVMENTDRFDRDELEAMMSIISKDEELPVYGLFVDAYYGKIKDKDLVATIVENEENLLDSATLSFDPVDVEAKQAWQYNGVQEVKSVSSSMKDVLIFIHDNVVGEKHPKPKKLIADAK